jgi:hypothetical protein
MKIKVNHFDLEVFRNKLSHLKDVDFSLFVDATPETQNELSEVNVLVLQEPNEYFRLHDWAIHNKHLFSPILTFNDNTDLHNLIRKCLILPYLTDSFHPSLIEDNRRTFDDTT